MHEDKKRLIKAIALPVAVIGFYPLISIVAQLSGSIDMSNYLFLLWGAFLAASFVAAYLKI